MKPSFQTIAGKGGIQFVVSETSPLFLNFSTKIVVVLGAFFYPKPALHETEIVFLMVPFQGCVPSCAATMTSPNKLSWVPSCVRPLTLGLARRKGEYRSMLSVV